jgi:aspartyl/asparaginyl beta-hydroxylase (cupin superfamily)
MSVGISESRARGRGVRTAMRVFKRVIPLTLAAVFVPRLTAFYIACGLIDVLRNQNRTRSTIDRYFFGNGLFTWLLSPFNLLLDLLCVPYRNRGIYRLADLPKEYQEEIQSVIDAAQRNDLVGKLREKAESQHRGMIFFKWYGKNVETSVEIPEYHQEYRYVRTIGVSVFNKKQSTGKHYGPLRLTLRVLYNVNNVEDRNVYLKVGPHLHRWCEEKLFIFDDTLQHQSCNQSDGVRYCLFLDVLRPSLMPGVLSIILRSIGGVLSRFNAVFYKRWTFIK